MSKRFYVAGPMGGYPGLNFAAFDAAASYIRAMGHECINPAEIDRAAGYTGNEVSVTKQMRQDALARDYLQLVTCDAIALLPGWENSAGAQAERRVAEDIGLEVWHVVPWGSLKREEPAVLVALSGFAQVGKDTVGSMMGDFDFERLAFADALKSVALATHPKVAELVRLAGWEETKRQYPDSRVFLQHLGQAVRDFVDPMAWVNAVLRQVKPGGRYVITDCRYENEAAAVKAAGGYVVRVERPGIGPANAHVSETALDDWDFDAVIRNNGDLEQLRSRVRLFVTSLSD